MKNRRKIDQKSTKNQLKMDQISTKNRPKSSILATKTGVPHWPGSWDDFSGVLGASWRRLGDILERLGGVLYDRRLRASWRRPGGVLEPPEQPFFTSWNMIKTSTSCGFKFLWKKTQPNSTCQFLNVFRDFDFDGKAAVKVKKKIS